MNAAFLRSYERRSQIRSYPIDGRETSNPGIGDSTTVTFMRADHLP